jgi:hypothetical protein
VSSETFRRCLLWKWCGSDIITTLIQTSIAVVASSFHDLVVPWKRSFPAVCVCWFCWHGKNAVHHITLFIYLPMFCMHSWTQCVCLCVCLGERWSECVWVCHLIVCVIAERERECVLYVSDCVLSHVGFTHNPGVVSASNFMAECTCSGGRGL